jgi:hypothetical protein
MIIEKQHHSSTWWDLLAFVGIIFSSVLSNHLKGEPQEENEEQETNGQILRVINRINVNVSHTTQHLLIRNKENDVVTDITFPWEPGVNGTIPPRSPAVLSGSTSSSMTDISTTEQQINFISTMTFASNFQVACPCCK